MTRMLSKSGVYKLKKKTRNHVQNLGARRTIFNNAHVMKENFWITVLKIWSVPIKIFFTKATWYHAFVDFCSKRCSINMSCYTTASLLQYLVHVWYIKNNDIWDSHDAGNDDGGFLGCNTMWTCTEISEFQRNILPWRWKRYFSETSVSTNKFTKHNNPGDNLNIKEMFPFQAMFLKLNISYNFNIKA